MFELTKIQYPYQSRIVHGINSGWYPVSVLDSGLRQNGVIGVCYLHKWVGSVLNIEKNITLYNLKQKEREPKSSLSFIHSELNTTS